MKKIINGKVYNTETAERLSGWSDGLGWRDFNHVEEELYRKKTGEYFLYGQGGPMSRYAVSEGNGWSSGDRIMPMSYEEATKWAEKHLDADEYEEIFGEISEDESQTVFSLRISTALLERLRRKADADGTSIGKYLIKVLEQA